MTEKDGRKVVEKMGMEVIQRAGIDYEVSVAFDINIKHQATSTKDRTGLFIDKPMFIIDETTGKKLVEWANTGVEYKEKEIAPQDDKFSKLIKESDCDDIKINCEKTYNKLMGTERDQLSIVAGSIKNEIAKAPIFTDEQKTKFYKFIDLYINS